MKNLLKTLIAFSLSLLAGLVVRRYRPRMVMVTGSVGKTSTKDAVATVLSKRFFIRKSSKSFNSEFGIPFTIFGVGSPWRDPFAWFRVFKNALALLFLPNHYPNMLVLEVGADRSGDIGRILRFFTPDAVVVTRLPEISVHVESYASPEEVQEEEFSPAFALVAEAPLIIPADDPFAVASSLRTPARTITYGTKQFAAVSIRKGAFYEENKRIVGMCALIASGGEEAEVLIKGSVGITQLLPVAAAVAAGKAFGISLAEALEALEGYEPPPGRGCVLNGVRGSVIIDDSYNASPAAVEEAIEALKKFPRAKRRIAVLGDMLELGRYSATEHERIGALAASIADILVTVGVRARTFAAAPGNAKVFQFDSSQAVAAALPELVREGDIILVKGSQSIRMERVVEALLADPADVSKLVRQEKAWKQKQ